MVMEAKATVRMAHGQEDRVGSLPTGCTLVYRDQPGPQDRGNSADFPKGSPPLRSRPSASTWEPPRRALRAQSRYAG